MDKYFSHPDPPVGGEGSLLKQLFLRDSSDHTEYMVRSGICGVAVSPPGTGGVPRDVSAEALAKVEAGGGGRNA